MRTFAERLSAAMEEKGMNPYKLAKFLEIPQQTIHRYLKEGRIPNGETLKIICEKLEKSADDLLGIDTKRQLEQSPSGDQAGGVRISTESVEKLIAQNADLSRAAASMGDAHKATAETNAELARLNAKLIADLELARKEIDNAKGCTPAAHAPAGGGRAAKHAAVG